MTKQDIISMTPGPELDGEVGHYIFGYEEHPFAAVYEVDGEVFPLPDYSTDISAAFEVVEKLKEKFVFDVCFSDKSWYAQFIKFYEEPGKVDEYGSNGATASEAICKAALIAVMKLEK